MGGGWADIYLKTIDDKVVWLQPGYITNVPWDLLDLFIEYLSNENSEKSISFQEEPGDPELLIHDNKLFVKRDYDAEEELVAGTKIEQGKAIFNNLGAGLKDWFDEFNHFSEENKENAQKYFKQFEDDYKKLGDLIKKI